MSIYTPEDFCVYLTVYTGNKMPMYYIGSSSIKKVLNGYHGSVSSSEFKLTWESELRDNPQNFKTSIISSHPTRKEAFDKEEKFQRHLNVALSEMYINKAIANGIFNNFGNKRPHSAETIEKIKKSDYLLNESRIRSAAEKSIQTKRNKSVEEKGRLAKEQSARSLLFHSKMSDETKQRKNEKLRKSNENRDKSILNKISESVSRHWSTVSVEEKKKMEDKKRKTREENIKNGYVRKSPEQTHICCLCCRKIFNPGNFKQHSNRAK